MLYCRAFSKIDFEGCTFFFLTNHESDNYVFNGAKIEWVNKFFAISIFILFLFEKSLV